MPSGKHEGLVELVRDQPGLVAEVLANLLGIQVPQFADTRVEAGDLTEWLPTEYRADAVVVLERAAGKPALAVVVEVQLGRDPTKVWSWPVYVATVRARLRCPTMLLVISTAAGTAARCAEPIELGHPGLALAPLVVGPADVPEVVDHGQAQRHPWLAVLSAVTHGGGGGGKQVLEALHAGLHALDAVRAGLYADIAIAALPVAARSYLEELMATGTYEYQSDFARNYYTQGRNEGRAEGEAKAILAMLESRGIEVEDDACERLVAQLERGRFETCVKRAMTASSVEELFI